MSDQFFEFIYEEAASERLDKFLVTCLPDFSRSRLQKLIADENVSINGQPAQKSGQVLEQGARIVVVIPAVRPSGLEAEEIPLQVIFENDDLMVINKPAGMVVHPSAGHSSQTLVNAALAHAPEMGGIGGEQRPGVVHRLDKDTSGLILLAKNDKMHGWLQEQFRLRKVKKVYMALVDGKPPTRTGRIEAPIGRDPIHRQKMAVVPAEKGREAVTEYLTLQNFLHHTLLEAHPFTGRTHQIRVHMAFLGCPIVGDRVYGHRHSSLPLERHFLHAARLTVLLPGENTERVFEAPLPEELEDVLRSLKVVSLPDSPTRG